MFESREKTIAYVKQALSLNLNKFYYAEQGAPPAFFSAELHVIKVPNYVVMLSGEQERYMFIDGQWSSHKISAGQAIFNISNSFSSTVRGAEGIGITLNSDFIRIVYADTTKLDFENIRFPYSGVEFPACYYHIYDSFRPATAGIIQTMEHLAREGDQSGINLKLLRISLEMLLEDLQNSKGNKGNAFNTFRQILQFTKEHHLEDITRSDLANYFEVTPSYISKLFKRFRKNENFSNYLLGLRLESAAELLQYDNIPIKELAYRCAFNSYSYFIRRFKKKFGMTPAIYRNSYRNNEQS